MLPNQWDSGMARVSKQFYNSVNFKSIELSNMENPPLQTEMAEGLVTVRIVMALSRNGVRGWYVPRILWRENGKVIPAASVEVV
jgi:hypothetical protein